MRIKSNRTKNQFILQEKNTRNKGYCDDNEKKNKSLEDYACSIDSIKQPGGFEGTTNYIINQLQKNFDSGRDVSKALRTLSPLDMDTQMPRMKAHEAEDKAVRDRENKEFEFDYVGESTDYHKRVREHDKNLSKACALLWGRCRTTLREIIESQT